MPVVDVGSNIPSTFAAMALAMIGHSLLLWQLGLKGLKLCTLPTNPVCLGFNCLPFSFKECFFLSLLSLVISEIVTGSFVLNMVLFQAEAKILIYRFSFRWCDLSDLFDHEGFHPSPLLFRSRMSN
ncbi:unnamed protein product [Eruca vesicaria subsp. sativa]|uniref:Uncharacterized protein n=1 Tax=Eruca vesicaria subsp. sativa TaxID=29727 RepID=A0ABC8LF66_ERUVS|nr:unnamed protein product [Eruca vesicaria subsp. sativa]